jgi:hypothetical protein
MERAPSNQEWEAPISWEQATSYIETNSVESLAKMNRNEVGRQAYRRAVAECTGNSSWLFIN